MNSRCGPVAGTSSAPAPACRGDGRCQDLRRLYHRLAQLFHPQPGFGRGDDQVGKGRGMAAGLLGGARLDLGELARLHLVGLGEDEGVADRGLVEHLHHVAVDVLEAVAAVDQHQRPLEHRAAAQIVVDQVAPLAGDVLRRLGEAVAGHVDQPQPHRLADLEEVELLGAARRVRGAGEGAASGQPVEQRRLADVGAAGEGDLRHGRVGQELELGRRLEERDRPGKELPGQLGLRLIVGAHRARGRGFLRLPEAGGGGGGGGAGAGPPLTPAPGHARLHARIAGVEQPLLGDGQDVVGDPVELEAGGEARHDHHQHPGHQREHLLLDRVGGRRVQPHLQPHGDAEQDRQHADGEHRRRLEGQEAEQVDRGERIGRGEVADPEHERLVAHLHREQQHLVERVEDRDLEQDRQAAGHRVDASPPCRA